LAEATGDDPERWALDGGEDFELLVTVAKRAFEPLAAWLRAASGTVLLRVGTITAEPGIRRADGTAIPPSGWDHLG
jgi:thiamine monophosphate kinase